MVRARPTLKARMSARPKPTRWSAIALRRTTSADGHGRIPAATPTPSRLRVSCSSSCSWWWWWWPWPSPPGAGTAAPSSTPTTRSRPRSAAGRRSGYGDLPRPSIAGARRRPCATPMAWAGGADRRWWRAGLHRKHQRWRRQRSPAWPGVHLHVHRPSGKEPRARLEVLAPALGSRCATGKLEAAPVCARRPRGRGRVPPASPPRRGRGGAERAGAAVEQILQIAEADDDDVVACWLSYVCCCRRRRGVRGAAQLSHGRDADLPGGGLPERAQLLIPTTSGSMVGRFCRARRTETDGCRAPRST